MNKIVDIRLRTAANIATLSKDFQLTAAKWVENMRGMGVEPLIYEGFRSMRRQTEIYTYGRTVQNPESKPGSGPNGLGAEATWANPGESKHNWGKAFDWVPVWVVAKMGDCWCADWDDVRSYALGESAAEALGFHGIKKETGHLEMS